MRDRFQRTIGRSAVPSILLLSMPLYAHAQDAAQGTSPWATLFDNAFGFTILFVFLAAIVGAIINARRRDRVLRSFHGYQATVLLADARRVWGQVETYPNGLVLKFAKPYRNKSGNVVTSFIFYQSEYASIRAIVRILEEMTPANRKKRESELRRTYRPSVWRRMKRWTLRQFSTLRDAVIQTVTLFIGQAKRALGTRGGLTGSLITTQESRINQISGTMLGAVQLANDPILERRLGYRCVAELKQGNDWVEIPGVLRDYTSDWIELWDARWPEQREIRMEAAPDASAKEPLRSENDDLALEYSGGSLTLRNKGNRELELAAVALGTDRHDLQRIRVEPAGQWDYAWKAPKDMPPVVLEYAAITPGDVLLPRSQTFVRHWSPRRKLTWLEAIRLG